VSSNLLKLNQDKTELIVFAPWNRVKQMSDFRSSDWTVPMATRWVLSFKYDYMIWPDLGQITHKKPRSSWWKALKDRTQRVAIGTVQSDDLKLQYDVPQASVLVPKLHCMYSKPVGEICKRQNLL
jgi:hypothetical protein